MLLFLCFQSFWSRSRYFFLSFYLLGFWRLFQGFKNWYYCHLQVPEFFFSSLARSTLFFFIFLFLLKIKWSGLVVSFGWLHFGLVFWSELGDSCLPHIILVLFSKTDSLFVRISFVCFVNFSHLLQFLVYHRFHPVEHTFFFISTSFAEFAYYIVYCFVSPFLHITGTCYSVWFHLFYLIY